MTSPADKVIDLIRLACDAAAPETEQRSAALIACRLIVRHSLYVGEPLVIPVCDGGRQPPPAPVPPPPPPTAASVPSVSRYAAVRRPAPRVIRSRFRSRCVRCWGMVQTDDLCIWVSGVGLSHPACYQD